MEKINLFDLHTDLPTAKMDKSEKISTGLNNAKKGYVCVNAIYRGNRAFEECEELATEFKKSGLKISFEDGCYSDYIYNNKEYGNGEKEIAIKVKNLANKLCSHAPLYISLGWNYDNLFAGGCAQNGNLTALGNIFIREINENGVAVDCAHLNKKSFYSVASVSKKFLCSHTAFEWVYPHRRNVDKKQIRTILEKGGIIGLIGVGHFLTGIKGNMNNYTQAFYLHLKEYLKVFGVNGLCIGSDFYGSDAPIFKDGDYSFCEKLISDLKKLGVKESEIDCILYQNACEFFN